MWGFDQAQWQGGLCRSVIERLEPLARHGNQIIAYSELIQGMELAEHEAWWPVVSDVLGVIVKACVEAGLPLLTALVVHKERLGPGNGFFEVAEQYGRKEPAQLDAVFWLDELEQVHRRWAIG